MTCSFLYLLQTDLNEMFFFGLIQLSKKHHKGRMLKVDWLDRLTFREIEMVNEVRMCSPNDILCMFSD